MMFRQPYTAKDFAWVKWGKKEINTAIRDALSGKKAAYARIKKIPDAERTFENTVYAIEATNHQLWCSQAIYLLMNVSPEARVREAAREAVEAFEKALVEIEYDRELALAIEAYARSGQAARLAPDEKKLLSDMRRDYRRMGLGLPQAKRRELKRNLRKLSELASRFSKNINDYQDQILVTEEELSGLPRHYQAGLRKRSDGKYIVTLAYPHLLPFLENAHSAEKREELAAKYLKKGGIANLRLAEKILALRYRNARLLGYETHAAYRLEERMARSPRKARAFVQSLLAKAGKKARLELKELERFKRRDLGDRRAVLAHYDLAYYANRLKQERYLVDNERVREYFPLDQVLAGMFEIYETLFSLRFEKTSGIALWHPEAELYRVIDRKTDALVAYFALDLYPRAGKYGHAAAFNVISGRVESLRGDTYVAPVTCLVTNFPKPAKAAPSLLSHSEVEALFHEFGHVMHEALTQARFASQSGFSVAWDFVEAPSQMFENWVWHEPTLKKMSRHYQSGEVLPKDLLAKIVAAKKHMIGYWTVRQLIFALYDMELHSGKPKKARFLRDFYRKLWRKHLGVTPPKDALFLAGFGHFTNYDAGYYSYMWSLVYATDMFTRFDRQGLLNPAAGRAYRRLVLEPGSSCREPDLVRAFLGRPPSQQAFLKEIGLK